MTYAELTRKLKRLGIELHRQGKGSHELWRDPSRNLYTMIPHHPGREIAKGTLAKILKNLNLTEDRLNDA